MSMNTEEKLTNPGFSTSDIEFTSGESQKVGPEHVTATENAADIGTPAIGQDAAIFLKTSDSEKSGSDAEPTKPEAFYVPADGDISASTSTVALTPQNTAADANKVTLTNSVEVAKPCQQEPPCTAAPAEGGASASTITVVTTSTNTSTTTDTATITNNAKVLQADEVLNDRAKASSLKLPKLKGSLYLNFVSTLVWLLGLAELVISGYMLLFGQAFDWVTKAFSNLNPKYTFYFGELSHDKVREIYQTILLLILLRALTLIIAGIAGYIRGSKNGLVHGAVGMKVASFFASLILTLLLVFLAAGYGISALHPQIMLGSSSTFMQGLFYDGKPFMTAMVSFVAFILCLILLIVPIMYVKASWKLRRANQTQPQKN